MSEIKGERSTAEGNAPDWVDFALGEDVRDERREEQDRMWAKAVADGRSHFSHREAALEYGPQFVRSIACFKIVELLLQGTYCKESVLHKVDENIVQIIVEYALPGQSILVPSLIYQREMAAYVRDFFRGSAPNDSPFRICLRKRPLFPFERKQGIYDVVRVMGEHEVVLHDGKLARNGRLLSMTHHRLLFDRVFNESDNNSVVCDDCARPLLQWAQQGKNGTLLCFGQTGTGKTHTLYGALQYAAQELRGWSLRLTFYEVHGNHCYDLLNDRQKVILRFDENDEVHLRGAKALCFDANHTYEELIRALDGAIRLRSSQVTERNPISSRSHAICTLELLPPDAANPPNCGTSQSLADFLKHRTEGTTPKRPRYGRLKLVDLAGSERNYETAGMSAAQHKESAEINLALMNLKHCFRAYQMSVSNPSRPPHIPYRGSMLTKVLRDCFSMDRGQRITIIATVSPSPVDLQHTLNSASHVLLMSSRIPAPERLATVEVPKDPDAPLSNVHISQWTNAQVQAWLSTAEKGRFAHLVLPPNMNGEGLLGLTSSNFADLFETQEQAARQSTEGPTWVISTEDSSRVRAIGQALYMAVRREELHHR